MDGTYMLYMDANEHKWMWMDVNGRINMNMNGCELMKRSGLSGCQRMPGWDVVRSWLACWICAQLCRKLEWWNPSDIFLGVLKNRWIPRSKFAPDRPRLWHPLGIWTGNHHISEVNHQKHHHGFRSYSPVERWFARYRCPNYPLVMSK